MSNKLLEEYIRNVVRETLTKEPQNEDLGAAFVDPIKDIFQTAMYGIKDMGVRLGATVQTLVKGLPTLYTPFLHADYASIRKSENDELEKLKAKYQDVLNRNEAAFVGTDLQPMAFLLDPYKFLGAKLAQATPLASLGILRTLQILTGGSSDTVNSAVQQWEHEFGLDRERVAGPYVAQHGQGDTWGGYGLPGGGGGMGAMSWDQGNVDYGSSSGGDYYGSGDLEEAAPQQQQPKVDQNQIKNTISALLKDPNVQAAISRSQISQQMGQDMMNVYVKHVAKFMQSKNYDDMMQKYGSALKAIDSKIEGTLKNVKPQELQAAKTAAFIEFKTMYKSFYIKQIQDLAKQHPHLATGAQKAIQQIQAMK